MCQISRLLLWKSPQECQNVTIKFCFTMRIFYELRYTVIIEIVWTFYLKSVPAKFKNILNLFLELSAGQVRQNCRATLAIPPEHQLQPSSTSNNQKTRVDSDINIDYKASSFDKLYIWRRKWDTAGFVRVHQRNIEMHSPSAAAMLTMVAAATIVRFPPVNMSYVFVREPAFLALVDVIHSMLQRATTREYRCYKRRQPECVPDHGNVHLPVTTVRHTQKCEKVKRDSELAELRKQNAMGMTMVMEIIAFIKAFVLQVLVKFKLW